MSQSPADRITAFRAPLSTLPAGRARSTLSRSPLPCFPLHPPCHSGFSHIMRRGASERRIGRAFDAKFLGREHGRRGAQIVGQQRKGSRTQDAG